MIGNLKFLLLCSLFAWSFVCYSVKIRFPDEELASESVLPLFESQKIVLDRKISLKHRLEVGGAVSFGLDEPFYFSIYGTGLASFYFTEEHSVNLIGTYFPPAYSGASEALKEGRGLKPAGKTFDVHKAPYPQMMAYLNYQYVPCYGKISLTKKGVMNLSIYVYGGPGVVVFNDSAKILAGNFGIGQKLYLNKWLALRGDIGFYGYRGPAPARIDLGTSTQSLQYNQVKPEHKRFIFNLMANIGVVFLI